MLQQSSYYLIEVYITFYQDFQMNIHANNAVTWWRNHLQFYHLLLWFGLNFWEQNFSCRSLFSMQQATFILSAIYFDLPDNSCFLINNLNYFIQHAILYTFKRKDFHFFAFIFIHILLCNVNFNSNNLTLDCFKTI